MTDGSALLAIEDGIALITLNRPDRRNAFDTAMLEALDGIVDAVNADRSLHGAIVTGAGKGFCAGRDLAEMPAIKARERAKSLPDAGGHESTMFARIEVPVVAAVNGAAVGGGLGFVVQCDYAVMSSEAVVADGHIPSGMAPSVAAHYIPRRIGSGAALRFFVKKGPTSAADALAMGLVDEVVAPDELLPAARRLLEPFRGVPSELLRHTTTLCRRAGEQPFERQMELVGLLRSIERRADA